MYIIIRYFTPPFRSSIAIIIFLPRTFRPTLYYDIVPNIPNRGGGGGGLDRGGLSTEARGERPSNILVLLCPTIIRTFAVFLLD